MEKLLVTLLFLLLLIPTHSQTSGPIEIKKVFGGIRLVQNGVTLKPKMVLSLMQYDDEAYANFKKAKSNYDAAQAFGFAGGFLIGWPLGAAVGGGDPQWGMAGVGAGLILISIPLSAAYAKHAKIAVNLYNGGDGASEKQPIRLVFYPYPGGLNFCLRF